MTVQEDRDDIEIRLLLEAIYQHYHYDFREYSYASIKRRLEQARTAFGMESFSDLQDKIISDDAFFHQMFAFLTVQVTEMFRDPSYFKAIRENVIPHLKTFPSLKVWVAGCSSGEELWSLMILFKEEGLWDRTIFYGTDINQDALEKAERGVYPLTRMPLYSQNYNMTGAQNSLSEYYTAAYGSAKFDKNLKKRAVFSDHSLVTDKVFGEMHLISCRNVLIYFKKPLQNRAFKLFKDSLVRGGFLGLGSKETIKFSEHENAFQTFIREERIYQKRTEALIS